MSAEKFINGFVAAGIVAGGGGFDQNANTAAVEFSSGSRDPIVAEAPNFADCDDYAMFSSSGGIGVGGQEQQTDGDGYEPPQIGPTQVASISESVTNPDSNTEGRVVSVPTLPSFEIPLDTAELLAASISSDPAVQEIYGQTGAVPVDWYVDVLKQHTANPDALKSFEDSVDQMRLFAGGVLQVFDRENPPITTEVVLTQSADGKPLAAVLMRVTDAVFDNEDQLVPPGSVIFIQNSGSIDEAIIVDVPEGPFSVKPLVVEQNGGDGSVVVPAVTFTAPGSSEERVARIPTMGDDGGLRFALPTEAVVVSERLNTRGADGQTLPRGPLGRGDRVRAVGGITMLPGQGGTPFMQVDFGDGQLGYIAAEPEFVSYEGLMYPPLKPVLTIEGEGDRFQNLTQAELREIAVNAERLTSHGSPIELSYVKHETASSEESRAEGLELFYIHPVLLDIPSVETTTIAGETWEIYTAPVLMQNRNGQYVVYKVDFGPRGGLVGSIAYPDGAIGVSGNHRALNSDEFLTSLTPGQQYRITLITFPPDAVDQFIDYHAGTTNHVIERQYNLLYFEHVDQGRSYVHIRGLTDNAATEDERPTLKGVGVGYSQRFS